MNIDIDAGAFIWSPEQTPYNLYNYTYFLLLLLLMYKIIISEWVRLVLWKKILARI